jgi:paraquat-inducible protein B
VSAKVHPKLVGAFVLGAVALLLAAVVLLSSGAWLQKKRYFVVFFPGSVKGLETGADVTFRGVKIGQVKDVTAFYAGGASPIQIEVVLEFRRNVIELTDSLIKAWGSMSDEEFGQEMIKRGIRGSMESASLLTGQRYIDFDFAPQKPARFLGVHRKYPELPTTPTAMEKIGEKVSQFLDKAADLPLDQMLDDFRKALQSLREVLESPDIDGALRGARKSMEALEPALAEARVAVKDADDLVKRLGGQVDDTGKEVRVTAADARKTLERAETAMNQLAKTLRGTDQTQLQATRTLSELSETLVTIRSLVEYIQTHPEAIVIGKPPEERKK